MSWPNVPIGEIFEVARGGSPRPIQKYLTDDPDGINWVMISDASLSNKYITKTKQRIIPEGRSKSRDVKPGDFLLTNSMSFGRPYIMQTTGCIHDGWLLLRPRSAQVDQEFFYHLFGSSEVYARFAARAPGSTVKNLNSDIVRETLVPLPPLAEQKRIAATLDQADSLRRLRQRTIDRLNTLGQAIFYEMFGDPEEMTGDRLGDHTTKIGSGATPKGGDAAYKAVGIPLVRSMNVRDGYFDPRGLAYIDEQQARKLDNVILQENDVLLNITGASVARVCRAPASVASGRVNQHVSIIRLSQTIQPEFLEAFLLFPKTKKKLLSIAESGATRQAITKAQIEEVRVPVPDVSQQRKFVSRKREAIAIQEAAIFQLERIQRLFSSLQHRAFRGEL